LTVRFRERPRSNCPVIPAKAGIHFDLRVKAASAMRQEPESKMDSGFRRNDDPIDIPRRFVGCTFGDF